MLALILNDTKLQKRFMWTIRGLLVVALLLPVLGFVKVIFFETGDSSFIFAEIELPVGTVKETTDITTRQFEEILYGIPEIELFQATVGSGSQFGGGASGGRNANFLIALNDDRTRDSLTIAKDINAQAASITSGIIIVDQPDSGPPTGAAITVSFKGDDLEALAEAAVNSARLLSLIEGTSNVQTTGSANGTEFVLRFDHQLAAQYGLTTQAVSSYLRAAVFGTDATSLTTLTDDIDVVVKLELVSSNFVVTWVIHVAYLE
jgi:HAE1 family hydrophobic/amphiphilic exporter-1